MPNAHEPKIYYVYNFDGNLVFSGLATEIADHFYVHPSSVRATANNVQKTLLRKYKVVNTGKSKHI